MYDSDNPSQPEQTRLEITQPGTEQLEHSLSARIYLYGPQPATPFEQTMPMTPLPTTSDVSSIRSTLYKLMSSEGQLFPPKRAWKRTRLIAIGTILLVLLVLLVGILVDTLVVYATPAIAIITPSSQTLSDTYTMTTGKHKPNTAYPLVAQLLTAATPTQSRTVNATGHTQVPATQAKGRLRLYTSALTPQTVAAGTIITGPHGVQIVLDATATIPAARPAGLRKPLSSGQSGYIPAHAVTPGAAGNTPPFNLGHETCCNNARVFVLDLTAFKGGKDARNYQFVRQSDVTTVLQPLMKQLNQQASTILKQHVKRGDSFGLWIACPASMKKNHPVGDKGQDVSSLIIQVSVSCTEVEYDKNAMQVQATRLLQAKAEHMLGNTSSLQGAISLNIQRQDILSDKSIALHVVASGVWAYKIDEAQIQTQAKMIAGKSAADANTLLSRQTYIKVVSIQGARFPSDPKQVKIIVQQMLPIDQHIH